MRVEKPCATPQVMSGVGPGRQTALRRPCAISGAFLGFGSHRPEREIGKGPDNLWAVGGLNYLVIECKSGVTAAQISKTDCNQLIGSVSWFTLLGSDPMPTSRRFELYEAVLRALAEFGDGTATDYLIPIASDRTQADPREVIEAVEAVERFGVSS
jgi:hypothetical protein